MHLDPQPIPLTGQVVSLEPLAMDHADALLEAAQSEAIWLHTVDQPRTMAAMHDYIVRALGERDHMTSLPFVVRHIATNRFIGCTRYANIAPLRRGLEIGFTWYAPEFWRTAVNTLAADNSLRGFAFDEQARQESNLQPPVLESRLDGPTRDTRARPSRFR